jgi:hypothetical protein
MVRRRYLASSNLDKGTAPSSIAGTGEKKNPAC